MFHFMKIITQTQKGGFLMMKPYSHIGTKKWQEDVVSLMDRLDKR